jgi:hypothetical protein
LCWGLDVGLFSSFGILWFFVLFQHASTTTCGPVLHGSMLAVWRKTNIPHTNRQRKTKQTQIRNKSTSSLVAQLKIFSPHKERKQKNPTQTTIGFFVRESRSQQNLILLFQAAENSVTAALLRRRHLTRQ